jgi:hypothetical protein
MTLRERVKLLPGVCGLMDSDRWVFLIEKAWQDQIDNPTTSVFNETTNDDSFPELRIRPFIAFYPFAGARGNYIRQLIWLAEVARRVRAGLWDDGQATYDNLKEYLLALEPKWPEVSEILSIADIDDQSATGIVQNWLA